MQEHHDSLIAVVRVRYEEQLLDFEGLLHREQENATERVHQRLRIGSETPNSSSVDGSHIFYGRISCVSVYPTALSPDRIKDHYLCAVLDRYVYVYVCMYVYVYDCKTLKKPPTYPHTHITPTDAWTHSACMA
jgi:hypothetical protein